MSDKSKIHQTAQEFNLPIRVLYRLQSKGVIGNPIQTEDMVFLGKLKTIWGKSWFLRAQISRFSKKQRETYLLKRPELNEKWERWVYALYFNNKIERGTGRRILNPERMIKVDRLLDQLEELFKVPPTPRIVLRVKEIRKKAQRDKSRKKDNQAPKCIVQEDSNLTSEFLWLDWD